MTGTGLSTELAMHERSLTISRERILRWLLGAMIGLSCVSFIEPSPYELLFFVLLPLTPFFRIAITRVNLTLFFILTTILVAQLFALVPYFGYWAVADQITPSMYTVYSAYLYLSAVLFAMILSTRTQERMDVVLKAYAFSCVFAGAWGILSFLNVGGIGDNEPIVGRVAGPFKDPNVLGSYCIMGVLYLGQSALLHKRFTLMKIVGLCIAAIGGVFFSMSRGSIGAMIFAATFMLTATYATAQKPIRRRMGNALMILFVMIGIGAAAAATNKDMRDNITMRAKVEQEYDGGETGRFGNQKRSIPMLLERPLGFGPFRFPEYFGLAPHNSYIGAFADAGWIGGFGFLLLALTSCFIGVRLAFTRSPFMRSAQVVAPAMIGFFLQALQIDIDHWRFVYLMIGAVWGMESARLLWLRRDAPQQNEAAIALATA
ncbi:MAG: O-antigen ligase family protein [Hyphomicrobiales bacterium]|nr:O-antigen ligase family protein [Hyphomicrobiales bacterium]